MNKEDDVRQDSAEDSDVNDCCGGVMMCVRFVFQSVFGCGKCRKSK